MISRKSAGLSAVFGRKNSSWSKGGYTVFEVLVVLSVSTVLLASVIGMLGTRQGRTETTQSLRELESKIQTVVSDVTNGYYPNGFDCEPQGSGVRIKTTTATGAGQNIGCTFLGKAITFGDTNARIVTLVGRQYTGADFSSNAPTSLTEAGLTAVAGLGGAPDLTDTYNYRYGLRVTKMFNITGDNEIILLAFISELGNSTSVDNPLTGSRSVILYGMSGISPYGGSNASLSANLNNPSNLFPLYRGARICFRTGNNQKGEITIGANATQTNTFVNIDEGVSSVCP